MGSNTEIDKENIIPSYEHLPEDVRLLLEERKKKRDEDEGEKRQDKKPPAPRHSLRLLGVKRKNYIEHTPEPKDYAGDSDWESYMRAT